MYIFQKKYRKVFNLKHKKVYNLCPETINFCKIKLLNENYITIDENFWYFFGEKYRGENFSSTFISRDNVEREKEEKI